MMPYTDRNPLLESYRRSLDENGNLVWPAPAPTPAPEAEEASPSSSWLSGLTGIPDTDEAAQRRALAMGLLRFGADVAKNNRADAFGPPKLGNLLVRGAYEGMQGLSGEATNWDKRQAEAVKLRTDTAKARKEESDTAWTLGQRQALLRIAQGQPQPGDEALVAAGLSARAPGNTGGAAANPAQGQPGTRSGMGMGMGNPMTTSWGRFPSLQINADEEMAKRGALCDKYGNPLPIPWKRRV